MFLDLIASYFPYALAALVAVVLLGIIAATLKSGVGKTPYQRRDALMSAAERRFYRALLQATPTGYTVFSKVRIADVLQVKSGLNSSDWRTAFNKISAKHFDFVLCRKDNFCVDAAIELDDKSHYQKKVRERDRFVEAACATAQLPLIRVQATSDYDSDDLRAQIEVQLRELKNSGKKR